MTSSDLEWLSKIFSDTKHRAVYLQQLSFLFLCLFCVFYVFSVGFVSVKCVELDFEPLIDSPLWPASQRTTVFTDSPPVNAVACVVIKFCWLLAWNSVTAWSLRFSVTLFALFCSVNLLIIHRHIWLVLFAMFECINVKQCLVYTSRGSVCLFLSRYVHV